MDTPSIIERIERMPRTRPSYSEEFRREAVELLLSSGRPLKQVAGELGISANALRSWRNRSLGAGRAGGAGADGPQDAADMRRLRRENEYLRRQRDILKKAVSILSENPQLGMR